jgi:VWFA-related protein
LLAAPAVAQEKPADREVAAAIGKGIEFLRGEQESAGNWSYTFNQDHTLGITALAGLALLENEIDRADPAIAKAEAVVKKLSLQSNQTYDVSLAILFLARVQGGSRGPNDEVIQLLGERLADGDLGGIWTYGLPTDGEGDKPLGNRRRRRYQGVGDNSNTQFALLGLWGASRHGFDANGALEAIDAHFRETQNSRSGGWGYTPDQPAGEAMTCAGLMGLAIAAARPSVAERQTARARGAALAADPAFRAALKAVARNAEEIGSGSDVYYIWSLERVCVALGLRDLEGLDWYAKGATELLRRQRPDGGWPQGRWGSLPESCLALLFLRKANLAFELDRVLKLPGSDPPRPAAGPEKAAAVPPAPTGDAEITIGSVSEQNFPDISFDFQVKRPGGEALLDARKEDFTVTEYDRPVNVLDFRSPVSTEFRPTTVVLVVDQSRSMEQEDRIGGLKGAVATFLKVMPPGSRVAVVAFSSSVDRICPFTTEPGKVQEAVNKLRPAGGTRYYDAVAEALDLIGREGGRRAIVAMTDGEDTVSRSATLEGVVKAARNAGVPVHTLGLGSEDEIASAELRQIADGTRGRYFPARQAAELRAIYEELARGLSQSYMVTYRSERRLPDGTLRPIGITYRASKRAAVATVFIPGMVVPAAGWSRLFLVLVTALVALAVLPGLRTAKAA